MESMSALSGRRFPLLCAMLLSVVAAPLAAPGETVTSPKRLKIGDVFRIVRDGFTDHGGYDGNVTPKTDANDGSNGDSPYYRRHNVARAWGSYGGYWYSSSHRESGEPDPRGEQWVDYVPPLNVLGGGTYRVKTWYRQSENRADYPARYIIHHAGGTTTVDRDQRIGTGMVSFDLGEWDLGTDGWIRVQDTGGQSISFGNMEFTYVQPVPEPSTLMLMAAGVGAVLKRALCRR